MNAHRVKPPEFPRHPRAAARRSHPECRIRVMASRAGPRACRMNARMLASGLPSRGVSDHPRYRVTIIGGGAACIAAGCADVRTGAKRPLWMSKKRRGAGGTEFAGSSPSVSRVSPWLKVRPTWRAFLRTFVQHFARL